MMKSCLFLIVLLICTLNVAQADNQEAWQELTDPGSTTDNARQVAQNSENFESTEERIIREHNEYLKSKNEEEREEELRQRIYHEGALYHIGFDIGFGELENFLFPNADGAAVLADSTLSIALSFQRFFFVDPRWGRAGLGFNLSGIGARKPFRSIGTFITVGPRVTYEALLGIGQVFVPMLTLGYDKVFNRIDDDDSELSDDFSSFVFELGLMINLNRADPHTGTQSLVSTGVKKFNLVINYQKRSGDGEARSSSAYQLGFIFEY